MEIKECPVCHSTNIRDDSIRNDNGIIGPGYKSWVVEEKYSCNECGVYFKPVVPKFIKFVCDLETEAKGHAKTVTNNPDHQLYVAQGYLNAMKKALSIIDEYTVEFGQWLREQRPDVFYGSSSTQDLYNIFKKQKEK